MTYKQKLDAMEQEINDAIHELDLFLGPETPERLIWEWCNADRRPSGNGPLLEVLM